MSARALRILASLLILGWLVTAVLTIANGWTPNALEPNGPRQFMLGAVAFLVSLSALEGYAAWSILSPRTLDHIGRRASFGFALYLPGVVLSGIMAHYNPTGFGTAHAVWLAGLTAAFGTISLASGVSAARRAFATRFGSRAA